MFEINFSKIKLSSIVHNETDNWNFPVAQWLRICLPMQGTRVQPWFRKIPHAAEQQTCVPQVLSVCFRACEPELLSLHATTTEAHAPTAHGTQQEKSLQWEARAPQPRVVSTHHNQE